MFRRIFKFKSKHLFYFYFLQFYGVNLILHSTQTGIVKIKIFQCSTKLEYQVKIYQLKKIINLKFVTLKVNKWGQIVGNRHIKSIKLHRAWMSYEWVTIQDISLQLSHEVDFFGPTQTE